MKRHEKFTYRDDLLTLLTTLVKKLECQMVPFKRNYGLKMRPNS